MYVYRKTQERTYCGAAEAEENQCAGKKDIRRQHYRFTKGRRQVGRPTYTNREKSRERGKAIWVKDVQHYRERINGRGGGEGGV